MQADPFHPGERLVQERVGVRMRMAARGSTFIRDRMTDQHRDFFATLPFVAVAVDPAGWPSGTLLTGSPGFVSSPDPRRLRITTVPDPLDLTASALKPGAAVGMLGIDLATRRRNRVNGRITRADPSGLEIAVQQSFGNCAQYIQSREIDPDPSRDAASRPEPLTGLDAQAGALVAGADTFFVASGNGTDLDMSHRGGRPGFVRVEGDVLTIPDFSGNRYFNTLGNFLVVPRAGLLFVDFRRGDLLHLSGTVEIVWDAAGVFDGADRLWRVRLSHGWRRRGAMPLRWSFRDYAPTTERTGTWTH